MSELTPEQQHIRLRIVGKPDDARGYALLVHDADTGEQVTNISRIVLTLDAVRLNYADVTYYLDGATTVTLPHEWSEVDVTAYVGSEQYEKAKGE